MECSRGRQPAEKRGKKPVKPRSGGGVQRDFRRRSAALGHVGEFHRGRSAHGYTPCAAPRQYPECATSKSASEAGIGHFLASASGWYR